MADFSFAYQATNQAEGKILENNSADKGGETYWGLNRASDSNWLGWEKIDFMRLAQGFPQIAYQDVGLSTLHRLYCQQKYWYSIRGDEIKNQSIADKLYDICFNEGIGEGIKFIQESINLLNFNANTKKPYIPDLAVDGIMGPVTLGAIQNFCALGMTDYIIKSLQVEQGSRYKDIVRGDSTQREFYKGWLNRTFM